MRIMFLDDNPNRRAAFRAKAIGCVVDFACDADEAIVLLDSDQKYDLIMLDHDLGGPEAEGRLLDNGKDGRTVAGFIAQNHPKHVDTTIVVHSLNPAGATIMVAVLRKAGYEAHQLPFGWRRFEKTEQGFRFKDDVGQVHPYEIDCPPE